MSHDVQWYSPAPLWSKRLGNGHRDRLRRPALLRFETDDFMAELQSSLSAGAGAFSALQAYYETNKGAEETTTGPTIPLYQPAHERYYLVTASLVCRERGLPDRAVDTANDERVHFVLRRLVQNSDGGTEIDGQRYAEYGWMTPPQNQNGDTTAPKEWRRVDVASQMGAAEERFSMFPQPYESTTPETRMKGPRRLWAGLIPVAQREEFETTPLAGGNGALTPGETSGVGLGTALGDPRKTMFEARVIRAFKSLRDNLDDPESTAEAEDVRGPLLFAWLDLWQFLNTHLPAVATAIREGDTVEEVNFEGNPGPKRALLRELAAMKVSELGWGENATDALRTIAEHDSSIEAGTFEDVPLPNLPSTGGDLDRSALADILGKVLKPNKEGQKLTEKRPNLQIDVNGALGELKDAGALPENLQPPSTAPLGGGLYVVRCLYERPNCPPNRRATMSPPSRPFHLASFFDAQAPARALNITLPGASVKDFRDSSQSVTMRFTAELRNQVQRIQDITLEQLQDGESGSSPGVNIGMICSLSIPIITICALVLLIIMVALLNIVFWWLPFFKICFPLPSSD